MFFKRKNPRIESYIPAKRYRDYSNLPFRLLRLYSFLLIAIPLAIGWFYIERHGTPHILYKYSYYGSRTNPNYTNCTYFGINGKKHRYVYDCPFFKLIKN